MFLLEGHGPELPGERADNASGPDEAGRRSPTRAIRRPEASEQTNSSDLSKQRQQGAADSGRRIGGGR